ncbi:TPA: hypothetical protein MBF77_000478 [Klebsiella aerogenes]|nr:hypothetical protein [Klebsiella aerogenes]HBT3285741.1 hypothetical protein [Klebsiella aerogenes]HBT3380394.1 hypothetical protein [Klebsiella aerogenes]
MLLPGTIKRPGIITARLSACAAAGRFFLPFIAFFIERDSTLYRKQYLLAGKNGTIVAVYTVFRFSHGFDRCA